MNTGTLLIGDERITYTSKTDTFVGLGRAADNTTAAGATASTLGAVITDNQTTITVANIAGFAELEV